MMLTREFSRRCGYRCIENLCGRGAELSSNTIFQRARHPHNARCFYFTNTDQMKKSDPYAALGLEWGATAVEIKDAYRRLARELHPDVSQLEPTVALNKFRLVKEAYDKLMNNKTLGTHRTDLWEEWSFAIWRSGDLIAQERTDVAGAMKKRPAKPAESIKRSWGVASLGHPDGRGATVGGGEYLTSSERQRRRSSTVGTGKSKWVEKKEFRPWNPEEGTLKRASHQYRRNKDDHGKIRTKERDQNS
mmetsp:Transcript_21000/g.44960  ORF Transcript_21000/g.44960 Transcript_21000/m.44960 type:complete len:247 (-) Transcript_21000:3-743(-)